MTLADRNNSRIESPLPRFEGVKAPPPELEFIWLELTWLEIIWLECVDVAP
jgi:hypothetical protein